MTADRILLWNIPGTPSHHWTKNCSGFDGLNRGRLVKLTEAEYATAQRCRCCPREFRPGGHPSTYRHARIKRSN